MPTAATAPKLPLGVDLLNPLNVKDFHQTWDGELVGKGRNGLCRFSEAVYGVRAAGMIILGYQKRGKNTLRGIVATFAPPSENDTQSYIEHVSKWTGWDPDKPVDLFEGDNLFVLLKAMSRQEIGSGRFSDAVFQKGAQMALEKRRVKARSETVKEGVGAVTGAAAVIEPARQAIEVLTPIAGLSSVTQYVLVAVVVVTFGAGLYMLLRGRKAA